MVLDDQISDVQLKKEHLSAKQVFILARISLASSTIFFLLVFLEGSFKFPSTREAKSNKDCNSASSEIEKGLKQQALHRAMSFVKCS